MDINFFQELKQEGGHGFYVGGFVRDKLMGFENKDFDIEVFGIDKNRLLLILEKFGAVKVVGQFEIFLLGKNVEVYLSKEEDLKTSAERRDLTMNAIYYDPLEDKIYDFYNGEKDIKEKILKFCSERTFTSDPLRILRTAYFSAKYNFIIDEKLMTLMKKNKDKILLVDDDRIFQQFEKILYLKENEEALNILHKIGILQLFFKNNDNLRVIKDVKKDRLLLWSVILYGEKDFHFIRNKNLVNEVKNLHWAYNELRSIKTNFSKIKLKKLSLKVPIRRVLKFYYYYDKDLDFVKKVLKSYYSFRRDLEPFIKGKDLVKLNYANKKDYGKILDLLYEKQLNEEIKTREEALIYLRKIPK